MTFARRLTEYREKRQAESEALRRVLCIPARESRGSYAPSGSYSAIAKASPVRSEAYRRAVASLCCVHCGRLPTQCAHSNTGKGMGIKACDLESFPLCPSCHRAFDQGALFTKDERRRIEPLWAAATRAAVLGAGLWPKGVPTP